MTNKKIYQKPLLIIELRDNNDIITQSQGDVTVNVNKEWGAWGDGMFTDET